MLTPTSTVAHFSGVERKQPQKLMDMVYCSQTMERVCDTILKTSNTDITVLIQGETGTGKELAARALHGLGKRRNQKFLSQNAGAMPDSLLESELFGHRRGSFSGAYDHKPGIFEEAHGATVFLDEIGEASQAFQVRLLRLLENGLFRRVGEHQERRVDVRIIAATNRNLMEEVRKGRFRADLYYRLSVFPIQLPPLRERREDIELLANYFAEAFCGELGRPFTGFSSDTMSRLKQHDWPGNIRELKNTVQRILVGAPLGETKGFEDRAIFPFDPNQPIRTLAEMEKAYIEHALQLNNGNKTRTAEQLGLNRSTFRFRLRKLGIPA